MYNYYSIVFISMYKRLFTCTISVKYTDMWVKSLTVVFHVFKRSPQVFNQKTP